MNDKLANRPQTISIQTLTEAKEYAEIIANSGLVPDDYAGKPDKVFAAIQLGAELGLAPLQSVQNIAVIGDRPSVWGDALLALIQSHPLCEDVIEEFDENKMIARCTVLRKGRKPVIRTFSKADAELAKLWGGRAGKSSPWQTYPKRMLQMRARGFACRDSFADALRGLSSAEEVQDYIDVEVKASDVTTRRSAPAAEPREPTNPAPAEPAAAQFWPADTYQFWKGEGKKLTEGSIHFLEHYAKAVSQSIEDGGPYEKEHLDACTEEIACREKAASAAQSTESPEAAADGAESARSGSGAGDDWRIPNGFQEESKLLTDASLGALEAVVAGVGKDIKEGNEDPDDRDLLKAIDVELKRRADAA